MLEGESRSAPFKESAGAIEDLVDQPSAFSMWESGMMKFFGETIRIQPACDISHLDGQKVEHASLDDPLSNKHHTYLHLIRLSSPTSIEIKRLLTFPPPIHPLPHILSPSRRTLSLSARDQTSSSSAPNRLIPTLASASSASDPHGT